MTLESATSERAGLARVALAGLVWGSIALFVRQIDTSPFVIVFWRVTVAGFVTMIYLLARGRLGELAELPSRKRLAIASMGVLLALNWVLFMGALQLVDVAVVVLLGYLGPVVVALLTPLVGKEPFDRRIVAPLAISLIGTIVILGPRELNFDGGPESLGVAMAFAASITYAMLVLNARRLVQGVSTSVYMLGEYIAAATVLLPAALFLPGPNTVIEWGSLGILGTVHTAATGLLIISALRTVRADRVAIMTYAEPVSAVFFAAAFLGESITLSTAIGGLAVVTGGLMVAHLQPSGTPEGPQTLTGRRKDEI
ncbi:MAG: DMT family transporter [Actinomycetota bacterium]|jgi:drug/metabolite transporter (DMT)-like permease|nr:DMT family transporter [Actinomycetota bacterium]